MKKLILVILLCVTSGALFSACSDDPVFLVTGPGRVEPNPSPTPIIEPPVPERIVLIYDLLLTQFPNGLAGVGVGNYVGSELWTFVNEFLAFYDGGAMFMLFDPITVDPSNLPPGSATPPPETLYTAGFISATQPDHRVLFSDGGTGNWQATYASVGFSYLTVYQCNVTLTAPPPPPSVPATTPRFQIEIEFSQQPC